MLHEVLGTRVSTETVCKRLRDVDLFNHVSERCPALNSDHQTASRIWEKPKVDWQRQIGNDSYLLVSLDFTYILAIDIRVN